MDSKPGSDSSVKSGVLAVYTISCPIWTAYGVNHRFVRISVSGGRIDIMDTGRGISPEQ